MSTEFDRYSTTYGDEVQRSIAFIGQNLDFFIRVKAAQIVELAGRRIGWPERLSVLDVGCGVGLTDAHLEGRFASLSGVDVSAGAVEQAAARNPWASYQAYDGVVLPFRDGSFDVTFMSCVLHHVAPSDRSGFAMEAARVTRVGGLVAAFDHNPVNPLTRLAVRRCEFDAHCELLSRHAAQAIFREADLDIVEAQYTLFFPWDRRVFRRVERVLTRLPFGAQYLVVGRR